MSLGMMLLVLAMVGGAYTTVRMLILYAAVPTGSLGAAYLIATTLAAGFTLMMLAAAILLAAAWSIRRKIDEGNRQRDHLIQQSNRFELPVSAVERSALQTGWATIDRQLREWDRNNVQPR